MNNTKVSLVPKANIELTEEEIVAARIAAADGTASQTSIEMLRRSVEQRRNALGVLIEDEQVSSSARLAKKLADIDSVLTSEEVIEAVKQGIIDSKDPAKSYCDFAKAANEISRRLKSQYDESFTADGLLSGSKKNQKIQIAFGNGKLAVAVDMNEGNNG